MPHGRHPLPAVAPLERVVVVEEPPLKPSEGGVIGEHAIILWRSAYFVEQSHCGASGWLYVVYFDSHYVEQVMRVVFDAKGWRCIAGPQAQWFD